MERDFARTPRQGLRVSLMRGPQSFCLMGRRKPRLSLKWLRQPLWHLSPLCSLTASTPHFYPWALQKNQEILYGYIFKSHRKTWKRKVFSSTSRKDGTSCSLKKVLVEISFILKQMRIRYVVYFLPWIDRSENWTRSTEVKWSLQTFCVSSKLLPKSTKYAFHPLSH